MVQDMMQSAGMYKHAFWGGTAHTREPISHTLFRWCESCSVTGPIGLYTEVDRSGRDVRGGWLHGGRQSLSSLACELELLCDMTDGSYDVPSQHHRTFKFLSYVTNSFQLVRCNLTTLPPQGVVELAHFEKA